MAKTAALLRQALVSWHALALSLDPLRVHMKLVMMSSVLPRRVSWSLAPAMVKHKVGLRRKARHSQQHDLKDSCKRCPGAAAK